jgi:hypothetical protein
MFSVLRFTDSDYPFAFGIFKLFLLFKTKNQYIRSPSHPVICEGWHVIHMWKHLNDLIISQHMDKQ